MDHMLTRHNDQARQLQRVAEKLALRIATFEAMVRPVPPTDAVLEQQKHTDLLGEFEKLLDEIDDACDTADPGRLQAAYQAVNRLATTVDRYGGQNPRAPSDPKLPRPRVNDLIHRLQALASAPPAPGTPPARQ